MNTTLIFIFFIYFFMLKKDDTNGNMIQSENIFNSLDTKQTYEKIDYLRSIGPYFPEWLVTILNKSILLTEKIVKVHELIEFIQTDHFIEPITPTKIDNNKERFNYIINTLKEEVPKERLNEMDYPMKLLLNYDKYKLLFVMMTQILSNPQKINEKDQLTQLAESLFDGKSEEGKEKMKEMLKMIEIMKVLDTSNKKDSKND